MLPLFCPTILPGRVLYGFTNMSLLSYQYHSFFKKLHHIQYYKVIIVNLDPLTMDSFQLGAIINIQLSNMI